MKNQNQRQIGSRTSLKFQKVPHPYNELVKDPFQTIQSVEIIQDTLNKIYKRGGQDLYIKYVVEKLPQYTSDHTQEILQCYENQLCFEQKKDIQNQLLNEDQELSTNLIDTWAFQSLKSEPKQIETLDTSKLYNQSSKILKPLEKFTKRLHSKSKLQENTQVEKIIPVFEKLIEVDPEPEPEEIEELLIYKKKCKLREERLLRDEVKQEKQINMQLTSQQQANQQQFKQSAQNKQQLNKQTTHDFDGNLIQVKQMNLDSLPPDIVIVQYKDQPPIVQKQAYERLGLNVFQPQDFRENSLLQSYVDKSTIKKKEQKKAQAQPIENFFDLQMGVNLIKEDGQKILGPEYAFTNRIKKSQYNKQCELESSEKSFQEKSIIIKHKETKSEMIKNMHVGRIEESEIKRETDMTNQYENQFEDKSYQFSDNNNKNIKIHKNKEYGKMIISLNKNQQSSRLYSAKPIQDQQKIRKQENNRVHIYNPEIIMPNQNINHNKKNTQKIQNFNERIMKNSEWGDAKPFTERNELPQLSSQRIKSAIHLNKNRNKRINV